MLLVAAGQGGQGGDIYVVDAVAVHIRGERRIQRVDAFHEEHVVLFQLHPPGLVEDGLALFEIEFGDNHFPAREQVVQVFVQKLHVHCSQRLEIIFPLLVLRGMLAVYEIIVQLYHLGVQAQHLALLRDAERTARLAAG